MESLESVKYWKTLANDKNDSIIFHDYIKMRSLWYREPNIFLLTFLSLLLLLLLSLSFVSSFSILICDGSIDEVCTRIWFSFYCVQIITVSTVPNSEPTSFVAEEKEVTLIIVNYQKEKRNTNHPTVSYIMCPTGIIINLYPNSQQVSGMRRGNDSILLCQIQQFVVAIIRTIAPL